MGRPQLLEPGPEPRAVLGLVPGRVRGWSQVWGRRPRRAWAQAQRPGPAHVSDLLAILTLCTYSVLICVISFRNTISYSNQGAHTNTSN